MRKWITILLVTCLPGAAWGQGRTGGETQAQQAVKKADEAFAANRLKDAIRLYNQALAHNRALTAAYEKLAIAYYAVRQYRAAVNKLAICLQVAPTNVKCNMWMGLHLLRLKQRAAGIVALQKAVGLNWKLPMAMRKLGRHYYKQSRWRRAEKAWWTFLKFRDRSWPKKVDFAAHYNLGKIYLKMGKYPAAATAFGKANRLRKKHSGAKLGLASAYIGRRYFNAALNLLLPLRKLAKKKPIIHFNLATCFHRMRRKRQALNHLKLYADRRPGDVRSLILKGDIYFQHSEFGPALAAYKQATLRAPGSMEATVKYGQALLARKRVKEAYTVLSAASMKRPKNTAVLKGLGLTLLALKRAKEAINIFTRLLRAQPGSSEGVALRGDAHLMANQVSQAITDYQNAHKLNKQSWRAKRGLIRALNRRARNHLDQKNTAAALTDLNSAFVLDPKRIFTNTNLGITYLVAKRYKEAARHLTFVQKRLPRNFAVNRLLARLYYDMDKLDQARAHYIKARQAAKNLPARFQAEVEIELGSLLAARKDIDTAVNVLKSAVSNAEGSKDLAPLAQGNLAIALLDRGYRNLEKGKGKQAVVDLEAAQGYVKRLSGNQPLLVRFLLAMAYLDTGRWAKAAAAFRRLSGRKTLAKVLKPPFDRLGASYFSAYTRYRRGGYEASAAAMSRLLRRAKGPVKIRIREIIRSAYEMRAAQHVRKGKQSKAAKLYRRARPYGMSRLGRHNQAVSWYRSGKKGKALAAWKRSGSASGLCNVGTHYDNAGQPKAAYTWYQKCAARGGASASVKKRIKTIGRLFGYK
jgi:tetratricopeptide (TPR) repeat protein